MVARCSIFASSSRNHFKFGADFIIPISNWMNLFVFYELKFLIASCFKRSKMCVKSFIVDQITHSLKVYECICYLSWACALGLQLKFHTGMLHITMFFNNLRNLFTLEYLCSSVATIVRYGL